MTHLSWYNRFIQQELKIDASRARLVEAYLRRQYGTLDALSAADVRREYTEGQIGRTIDAAPAEAERLARSFGL